MFLFTVDMIIFQGERVTITGYTITQDLLLQELYKDSIEIGGDQVNKAFEKLLTEIFGVKVMTKFTCSEAYDYLELRHKFEAKKRTYNGENKVNLNIPLSLLQIFEEEMGISITEYISNNTQFPEKIKFNFNKMILTADVFKKLFETPFKQITSYVIDALQTPKMKDTKYIIMVGGFSGSPFLQNMFKKEFPYIHVIIPPEPELATVMGAVIFGHKGREISVIDRTPCSRVEKFINIFKK